MFVGLEDALEQRGRGFQRVVQPLVADRAGWPSAKSSSASRAFCPSPMARAICSVMAGDRHVGRAGPEHRFCFM